MATINFNNLCSYALALDASIESSEFKRIPSWNRGIEG